MRKKVTWLIIFFAFSFIPPSFGYLRDSDAGHGQFAPDRLIVKFKTSVVSKAGGASQLAAIQELNKKYNVSNIISLKQEAAISNSAEFLNRVYLFSFEAGADLRSISEDYNSLPDIEYAEPDYMAELHDVDDSFFEQQWGLTNSGQWHYYIDRRSGDENDKLVFVQGLSGADINAGELLNNPPDNTETVVVAIMDTGVDLDHPDLAEKIWHNPREIPANEKDDDNNGYIDDINGWDFAASEDVVAIDSEDNDPTDYYGHGSHCAGIVASITGNGTGISGISDRSEIMALKILPWPLMSKVGRALIYAADNGADVINMSFGFPFYSYFLEDAILYARSKGVVLVASTGNSGIVEYNYPAASPYTIAVGASSDSDLVTGFSTYGNHMDLCAPGEAILSLRADTTDMYGDHEPQVHIIGENYYLSSGTSMAAPHVVGAAAVLLSISPGLTPDAVQEVLQQTAKDYIDPYGTGENYPGWDIYSGHGRIDLGNAINNLPSIRTKIFAPGCNEVVRGVVEVTGIADGNDFQSYVLEYGEGKSPDNWNQIVFSGLPVTDELLGNWNTLGLSGTYTLRLSSGTQNVYTRTVFIANSAAANIMTPKNYDTVSNIVEIMANAFAPDFTHFELQFGEGEEPTSWEMIAAGSVPLKNSKITDYIVEGLAEGLYSIRLAVYSDSKLASEDIVTFYVKSRYAGDDAWRIEVDGPLGILANYGDFDRDGVNEILAGSGNGFRIYNPDGAIDDNPILPVMPDGNYIIPPAVGDVNGDGFDDFAVIESDQPRLFIYRSNDTIAEITLDWRPDLDDFFALEHDFPKVFLKDIDGDGSDEIHVVRNPSIMPGALIYRNNGEQIASFEGAIEYLPADLNRDGTDEIYTYYNGASILIQSDIDGNAVDTLELRADGAPVLCKGITAFDVDRDGLLELALFCDNSNTGYWLFVIESGLQLKPGWPRNLNLRSFLVPSVPTFADIDLDGDVEILCSYYDFSVSYVLVWNLDGSSFIPGSPDGLFATTPSPGILNMLTVADVSGDGLPEVIASCNYDLFFTYRVQRIYAWDNSGDIIDGFPIITTPNIPLSIFSDYRFTPMLGDVDNDGKIDLTMTASDSALVFLNFNNAVYDSAAAQITSWRYNRRLNNNAYFNGDIATDIEDDEDILPENFALMQNFPNPFNPSTNIVFSLPSRSEVKLEIFNILGRKIKTVVNEDLSAGRHQIKWDGKDEKGNDVSSGIYFYRLKTDEYTETRKMTLIK